MLILDLETSCTSQGLSNIMGFVNNTLTIIQIVVPILLLNQYLLN